MRPTAISVLALGSIAFALSAAAQNAPADPLSGIVGKPTFTNITMNVDVNRSAKETWAIVGPFCAGISAWAQMPCTMLMGKEGEVGAMRSIGNEVMAGKSDLSYTYYMPPRTDRPYNHYHGTLEARPVTATTSTLIYTLMFDTSVQADAAAREKYAQAMRGTFTRFLGNMKILAEGGTLPAKK
jgi:hypothetical protein